MVWPFSRKDKEGADEPRGRGNDRSTPALSIRNQRSAPPGSRSGGHYGPYGGHHNRSASEDAAMQHHRGLPQPRNNAGPGCASPCGYHTPQNYDAMCPGGGQSPRRIDIVSRSGQTISIQSAGQHMPQQQYMPCYGHQPIPCCGAPAAMMVMTPPQQHSPVMQVSGIVRNVGGIPVVVPMNQQMLHY